MLKSRKGEISRGKKGGGIPHAKGHPKKKKLINVILKGEINSIFGLKKVPASTREGVGAAEENGCLRKRVASRWVGQKKAN